MKRTLTIPFAPRATGEDAKAINDSARGVGQIVSELQTIARLDKSGDLDVKGGRLFCLPATRANLPATASTRNTLRLGVTTDANNQWIMPFAGSVLALSWHLIGTLTGSDTLSFGFGVGIDGSEFQDELVKTISSSNGASPKGIVRFAKDRYTWREDQYLQIIAQSGASFGTATHDVECILWGEM